MALRETSTKERLLGIIDDIDIASRWGLIKFLLIESLLRKILTRFCVWSLILNFSRDSKYLLSWLDSTLVQHLISFTKNLFLVPLGRELFEKSVVQKSEKLSQAEQSQLIQLLMSKNEEFKETYEVCMRWDIEDKLYPWNYLNSSNYFSVKLAIEQGEIEANMMELAEDVHREDEEVQALEKCLKEAETLLSTALFQAKQKLDQMTKAQEHSVSSEDLIRFAHRISSTNAVAAPSNWTPGDPRRPYPTDLEMRMGFLGKLNESPASATSSSFLEFPNNGFPFGTSGGSENPILVSGSYVHPPHFSTAVGVDPSTRNHEDVDLMSSDSSSTSSSDSQ